MSLDELLEVDHRAHTDTRRSAYAAQDLKRFFSEQNQITFDYYLEASGRSRNEVLDALATSVASDAVIAGEAWYGLLAEVLTTPFIRNADPNILGAEGLRKPVFPLLHWADLQLAPWASRYGSAWRNLRRSLLVLLSDQLNAVTVKVAVLEASIWALGRTDGAKSEDAFSAALAASPRMIQRFYLTYPALARLAATITTQWAVNCDELLSRFLKDRAAIDTAFPALTGRALTLIEGTGADLHNHGRQVLRLGFEGGGRLIYKPRPAAVDTSYQSLLAWWNRTGAGPAMRPIGLLDQGDYGWFEFVEREELQTPDQAAAFYRRHGVHLALLYLLKGTDFHFENVIASGEHPILIDLETLFHGDAHEPDSRPPTPSQTALRYSIFQTGLLPGWGEGDRFNPGPDISGIGGREGQHFRAKGEVIVEDEEGALRVEWRKQPVEERANRPRLAGEALNPGLYADAVREGFEVCYRRMMAHAGDLLEASGLERALRDAQIRHVPTGTVVYTSLLRRAAHPDFLRRTVHRELLFATLAWRIRGRPGTAGLLDSEIACLRRGDVPKFMTRPSTTAMWDDDGKVIEDYLARPSAEVVTSRLAGLSEENLAFQDGIVALGMATLLRRGEPGADLAEPWMASDEVLGPGEIEAEVGALVGRLTGSVLDGKGRYDWIGVAQDEYGGCRIDGVGPDLYDGAPGIGLFLAHAGRRLDDARALEIGYGCGKAAVAAFGETLVRLGGGFMGAAGQAHAVMRLAEIYDEPGWTRTVLGRLVEAADTIAGDRFFDLIAGSAGLCGVLVAACRDNPDQGLVDLAVAGAEHLIASKVECERGWGWPARNSPVPLTGFSHGAAGVGWALMHVGALAGRPDLIEAGRAAFDYERSVFSHEHEGWPDFREMPGVQGPVYASAWCHGRPGIGLARATLPPHLIGETERQEIAVAVAVMRQAPLAGSDCLCHGEIGNIETLLAAGRALGDGALISLARNRAATAVRRARARGAWRCGAAPDIPSPGLMTGLAGVGYGLLRIHDPDRVPSILTLGL